MVMTFRQRMEYLDEVRRKYLDMKKHPGGTYVAVHLSKQSAKELGAWVNSHNIPNKADPKQYHTTITYSRKGVPDVVNYKIDLPINCKITEWKIFPHGEKKCLVGIVDCSILEDHHNAIKNTYGATHDYPDYAPHITISYDYGDNPVPKDVPDFNIVYDKTKVEPLDVDYTSIKKS